MTRLVYRKIEIRLEGDQTEELHDWLFGALHTYLEANLNEDGTFPVNDVLTALAMVTAASITADRADDVDAVIREVNSFSEKLQVAIVTAMDLDAFDEGRPN